MSKTVRFDEDSLIMIKNRLNEVMVGTDGVSHNDVSVKLYHGTTVDALLMIMESGIMSAKRGKQNGETYAINWFSLKEGNNFNRGALFSIEVPSDEFGEKFNMMNSSEAVSKDDELNISAYNLKIEKICGMSSGAIKRSYERYVKEGESYPLERVGYLFDYFIDEVQDNETIFPNLLFHNWDKYFPMIMKNILGENINESVNEAAPEVDVYEIGGEENAPVGGQCFHEKKIEEATLNLPQGLIEFLMKNKSDKFSNWVVFDLNNFSTYPRYFQKRQTAYDFYKWMKMDYNCKPKLLNLDKINNAVNESYNVSVRGDLDLINTIEFIPHENAREEGYTDDELEDFEPYYEIEAMDMNGDTILYADLTVDELFDYFPQSIINDIVERDNSSSTRLSNPSINQYRIEDILYRDTTPSDVNDVDDVNRIAKKIQTGGPSAYLLTDGDIISFQDHIYITSIDGITPDKFMALGNIRLTNGGFELIKEPTREQMRELKRWIRGMDSGIHVDFCEESHQTYPRTLFSTSYMSPNAERIVNDIYYYFEEGVKPQDNFYESKENKVMTSKELLKEYNADLRLPFEEPEYANKFYIEQYKDWLEDYGRYGKLPNGTLDFWDEIRKAVTKIKDEQLHGRFDSSMPQDMTVDEVINDLKTRLIGQYIKFTNDGKVYVERAISINKRPRSYDNDQRTDFYKKLWKDYNNNVGGCWSYRKDGAQAYCGDDYGYSIILRGYIRTDDIDFIKTVQLNYHYPDEHEIRVKPFAKVELFNFSYGEDTINFNKKLIVSSTYSGNNSKFVGNIGKVDDGFGGITYINRQNKILNGEEYNNELNKYVDDCLAKGYELSDIFDVCFSFKNGFAVVQIGEKWTFIREDGKRINNEWYDFCSNFKNGFARVRIGEKWTFIREDGQHMNNEWYDFCSNFKNGFARVRLDGKWYKIDTSGRRFAAESVNKNNKKLIMNENQLIALKENIESEVESNEIDLSSFKKNDTLTKRIWDGMDLNPRVRLKLLDIADDFWKFVNLTWVKPKNIILTGSICNFNWSQYSDIDLHLIVDFNEIDEKTEFVRDYLDAKKNEWNNGHKGLQIMGYQVELYVQNVGEIPESNGIYDLEENDWIKEPNPDDIKPIRLNKFSIKDKAAKIMTIIDDMYDALAATDDSYEIEQMGDDADYLWKKVKEMRKRSLEKHGESGSGNIVYKILRREFYLDKLWHLKNMCYDKTNSITESVDGKDLDIFSLAKERFGTTYDIRECGYVLPDGSMLDFSGRHMVTGNTDTSHLKGRRSVDHREIEDLNWDKDMTVRNNLNVNMPEFIRKGAIRIHCSNTWSSINLFVKPTKQQINPLLRLIQYSKGNVTVEIGDGDNSYEYAEWDEANPRRVVNDIIRYFDEGIKLIGNVKESVKKISVTEGARYDIFRNNQVARYKVIGEMAEDGYVFHGTGEDGNGTEWDTVDPTRIKGGSRGTYGYGIYFTAHAYKCEKYTTYTDGHYIIANINGFDIINLRDKINKDNNIFLDKQKEYYLLQNELDNARNNRDYNRISSMIEEYDNTVDKDLLNAIIQVISESDENDLTYFYLNNHIPLLWYSDGDPDKQLSKLYLSLGIDGFEFDTEYVLFNFELLNHAIVKDKEALITKYMQKNIEWFKEKNIHVDENEIHNLDEIKLIL